MSENDRCLGLSCYYSNFVNSSNPVFKRGGIANNGSNSGVFAFNNNTGDANTNNSFRPCLVSPHFDAHLFRDIYRLKIQKGVSSRRTPSDLVSKKFNSFDIGLYLYHKHINSNFRVSSKMANIRNYARQYLSDTAFINYYARDLVVSRG